MRALAGTDLDDQRTARTENLLTGGLDWDFFLKLADRHGLVPMLHWHLSRHFPECAPPASARFLAEQFQATVQTNLKLAAELVRVLQLLDANNIPAIPFKGPTLAVTLYGNLALREFSDLDIILHRADILRARDLLLADGYLAEHDLTPAQERFFLNTDCQYTFQKFDGQLRVELHWDIVPRYCGLRLEPSRWFERLQTATVASAAVTSLSPEDLLLVLCVHGAKHGWQRMAWIGDVAELLRIYPALNWRRLAEQADAARARRLLGLGLGLAHSLLDAKLPEEWLLEVQQDMKVQSMMEEVCQGLTGRAAEPWELHRFLIGALSPRQRAMYLLRSALTPTPAEWALVNLPSFLFPLYSLLRLGRLTVKYAARAWRGPGRHEPKETR
ncbi:MAG: nucleotidyltransferase family protein [Acidobacteria bacterium]|nr:nucleotidyltransferase family protein [Acidobacteriota bacterium]